MRELLTLVTTSSEVIVLEEKCSCCEDGNIKDGWLAPHYWKKCSECAGSGIVLNDNGKTIVLLISTYANCKTVIERRSL